MMIPMSLLVATALITLSESKPLSYSTYQIRGLPVEERSAYVPYLTDGGEASVNDIYWPQVPEEENVKIMNNTVNSIKRIKRGTSLSVSNPLDVLRSRILLELIRRQSERDQQQINSNRRFLATVGKRSLRDITLDIPQLLKTKNERIINSQQPIENPKYSQFPSNGQLHSTVDWYNTDNFANLYEKNNQLQQMETDELGLL